MARSNQFLQKLPNTGKYVKSVFFNPILVVVFLLLLGFSACSQDEDHAPDPVHVRVGSPLRDFLFFKEGSYWIYKSNDGLYDTVTVTRYKVDTLIFVDEKGRLISTQEYFWFTHYSSYLRKELKIYRADVAPKVQNIDVFTNFTTAYFLLYPSELKRKYCSSVYSNCYQVVEMSDTSFQNNLLKKWVIEYDKWTIYNAQPVVVVFVEGIGIVKKVTAYQSRTWELIDYNLFR